MGYTRIEPEPESKGIKQEKEGIRQINGQKTQKNGRIFV